MRYGKRADPAMPAAGEAGDHTARLITGCAAIAAGLAVAIGAMGAHAFRDAGDLRGAGLMETAGQYLMWHALAVLALSRLRPALHGPMILLLASSGLFAGTLALLALGGPGWLGAVTPVGGTGLIAGWLLVAWAILRKPATG
jgi:uncharacterized membrane protein YgdD (TMEM256/DUF423 family)